MYGNWQEVAAVLSSHASAGDEGMAGRYLPHRDTRLVESTHRKVGGSSERMKLPEKTFFSSKRDDLVVRAWCLRLRSDLNEFEKDFLACAEKAVDKKDPSFSQRARTIFLLLDGYKERFEDGSMSRGERYRVLDTQQEREQYKAGVLRDLSQVLITFQNVCNLNKMVKLALDNLDAVAA